MDSDSDVNNYFIRKNLTFKQRNSLQKKRTNFSRHTKPKT